MRFIFIFTINTKESFAVSMCVCVCVCTIIGFAYYTQQNKIIFKAKQIWFIALFADVC